MVSFWLPRFSELCPNAPLPRLSVGERGTVAPGIDRLRLRALPAVGTGEVQLLYAGNQFEIIAGPSCNGGFVWWRVSVDNGGSGWVAEGTWTEYYLQPLERSTGVCERVDLPWAHLLVTAACKIIGL
jgi:hypothetical protein